jgi:hypothetical protein
VSFLCWKFILGHNSAKVRFTNIVVTHAKCFVMLCIFVMYDITSLVLRKFKGLCCLFYARLCCFFLYV